MAHVYAHSSFPSGGCGSKDEQEKIYNFLYRNTFSGLTMELSSYIGLASVLDYMEQNIGNPKHDITVLFPMQANGTEMSSIYAAYPTRSAVDLTVGISSLSRLSAVSSHDACASVPAKSLNWLTDMKFILDDWL